MSAAKVARAQDPAARSERWLLATATLAIVIALLAGGGAAWRFWVENESLRAASSAAAKQIEMLNAKLSEIHERLTASQQGQSGEKVAHEQTTARLKIKETELAYLKRNLTSAQNELLNLADNLESTLRDRAVLTEQVEKLGSALSERDEILVSLEKELVNTYNQLDASQASRSELEQTLAENLRSNQALLAERDGLQNRLADLVSRYAATLAGLERKFDGANARLNDSHTALNRLSRELQAARQSHQTLSEQQQSLQERLAKNQRTLAQASATAAALGAEKAALETRLHTALSARQALLQQHQKLSARIAAAAATCAYASANQEMLTQGLKQMSEREHALLAQYERLQTRVATTQAALVACHDQPPDTVKSRRTAPEQAPREAP